MSAHVVIVQELLAQYRTEFYECLRDRLWEYDIALTLVYGRARGIRAERADEARLSWGREIRNRSIGMGRGRHLVWQPVLQEVRSADLVIVEQANKHLVNPLLMAWRRFGGPRIAFWGHGADIQDGGSRPISAWAKGSLSSRVDWWFAYSEGCAERVAAGGFPREQITVVQNATGYVPGRGVERVKGRCVFIGALHPDKRIDFLLESVSILARVPDFSLIVAGAGPEHGRLVAAVQARAEVSVRGPIFGREKSDLLESSQMILMPGLVGLVAVDSFAARTPIVTVDGSRHSPEFEYLSSSNSVVLPQSTSASSYAGEVERLLSDPARLESLRNGCVDSSERFNLSAMVDFFTAGVRDALNKSQQS